MIDGTPSEILTLLESRREIIDTLECRPAQKPELEDCVGISRSTVDRAINELEMAGLVTRDDRGYTLTLYGELLVENYDSYLEQSQDIARAKTLLEALPAGAPMSVDFLSGASVHCSSPPAPHRPISQFDTLLQEADRMRGFSRTISQSTTPRLIHERICGGDLHGELVVSSHLAEYMQTERYQQESEMAETGRYRLFEIESVPYGLVLLDVDGRTHVTLFAYRNTNDLLGTIRNDTPQAIAWARSLYERYRSESTEITQDFL